jgi:hypothetical protein
MTIDDIVRKQIKAELLELGYKYHYYDKHNQVYVFNDTRSKDLLEVTMPKYELMKWKVIKQ